VFKIIDSGESFKESRDSQMGSLSQQREVEKKLSRMSDSALSI